MTDLTPTPGCQTCILLMKQVAELLERLKAAEVKIADLEQQLKQNSSNSHRPPSSDPPWKPKPAQEKPTGRKPGGQPGHEGKTRGNYPPELVGEIRDHRPAACRWSGMVQGIR